MTHAARLLRSGALVAFPTDTLPVVASLVASGRLAEIAGAGAPVALIADVAALGIEPTPRARSFMGRWWPGGVALALPGQGVSPPCVARVPDHPVALALLSELGEPVVAVEVPAPPPGIETLAGGPPPGGRPATVLSLAGPDAEVVREGLVPGRELLLHELAWRFRVHAGRDVRGRSPLYEAVCAAVAERPEVLELLLDTRPGQRRPTLLLAAAHHLLLAGAEHPVAGSYPSLGGCRPPDPGLGARFCDFVLANADSIRALVRARRTQTNEVGRCTGLVLGLALLPPPIALIDVGASAGLNLNLDRYAYDYGPAGRIETRGAEVVLRCAVRGGRVPLPAAPPAIAWRAGIDLNPLDAADPETGRWLEALVWPEDTDRARVLRAALAVARRHPPRVRRGDAVELLPAVAAEAPGGATLTVVHTNVIGYLGRAERARFAERCRELGARVLSLEFPVGAADAHNRLELDGRLLALADQHGRWIEWAAP